MKHNVLEEVAYLYQTQLYAAILSGLKICEAHRIAKESTKFVSSSHINPDTHIEEMI